MDTHIPGAKELCLRDMEDCIGAGDSWRDDFLLVLNEVFTDLHGREKAVGSFREVTDNLDARITEVFGKNVETDIVLYIGLCNGAGWVTTVNKKTTVLLGIEKIIELDWCGIDDMTGLIIHELGHVYHTQHGLFGCDADSPQDKLLWQLFTEGVAMVFEQAVIGDNEYFHQDKNGWKSWCDKHAELIKESFSEDFRNMTEKNQRYFGDWVSFEGQPDTGYYLGALFVRHLLRHDSFDEIIKYDIQKVRNGYYGFTAE